MRPVCIVGGGAKAKRARKSAAPTVHESAEAGPSTQPLESGAIAAEGVDDDDDESDPLRPGVVLNPKQKIRSGQQRQRRHLSAHEQGKKKKNRKGKH